MREISPVIPLTVDNGMVIPLTSDDSRIVSMTIPIIVDRNIGRQFKWQPQSGDGDIIEWRTAEIPSAIQKSIQESLDRAKRRFG